MKSSFKMSQSSPATGVLTIFTVWIALSVGLSSFHACSGRENWDPMNPFGEGTQTSLEGIDDTEAENFDVDNADDIVENVSFVRTVKVTFNEGGTASIEGGAGLEVSISGNGVTLTNPKSEFIKYVLTGSASDGFFKLYSPSKQAVYLSSLSLTNPSGSAINSQSHKRLYVVLEGENTLGDGEVDSEGDYPSETEDEDMKAVLFAEGKIILSGNGTLRVNALGKAGITSDDYVRFRDGVKVDISTKFGHGVRGKDAIIVSGGELNLSVAANGKKGFSSDTLVYVGGGKTVITMTGSAGLIDDEVNGVAGIKADRRFEMVAGSLDITCTGTGAKGISGDNVAYIKGGEISAVCKGANYGSSSSQGGFGPGGGGGFGPGGGGFGGGGFGGNGSSSSDDGSFSSKAIKFDGNMYISGGRVYAKAAYHEGIEAKGTLVISGGEVFSESSDDAINCGLDMHITGGVIVAHSTGNDGLDANNNVIIDGGLVLAVGTGSPETSIDANTEGGYKAYFNKGTIIGVGSGTSGMTSSLAGFSTTPTASTTYSVMNGSTPLIQFSLPALSSSGGMGGGMGSGSLSMFVVSDKLTSGTTYTLVKGGTISGGSSHFDMIYDPCGTVSGGTQSDVKASK